MNGSRGAVLDATFGTGFAQAGLQMNTTSNPNKTVNDLSQIIVSFDARVTTSTFGAADFYVNTYPATPNGITYGLRRTLFNPTNTYQTFTFNLGAMRLQGNDIVPTFPTMQLSWQLSYQNGWTPGTHTLQIDNIHVNVVPAPGSLVTALIGVVPGVLVLRRRRKSVIGN